MKTASLTRKIHKWIFLFIGLQVLLWTLSGAYMVVMNLDFIHGDHLVKNLREPLTEISPELISTRELLRDREQVRSVKLTSIRGKLFYILHDNSGTYRVDAHSGERVAPIDKTAAIELAAHYYNGETSPISANLLTDNPPSEIPARILPVWRVDFDDRFGTSFYIDPDTAALITRRHNFWRAFDFFWMLHIMDYEEREDIHNPLLFSASLFSLISVLAGLILLFYSFGGRTAAPKPSGKLKGAAQ